MHEKSENERKVGKKNKPKMTMKLHKNNIQQFSNNFRFSCAIKSSWENQFHFSIKRRGVENQSEKRKQQSEKRKLQKQNEFKR